MAVEYLHLSLGLESGIEVVVAASLAVVLIRTGGPWHPRSLYRQNVRGDVDADDFVVVAAAAAANSAAGHSAVVPIID